MQCKYSKEIAYGSKVEMEHTKSHKVARKIASDHLKENPCYYTYLKKFEKTMKVKM